MRRLPTPRLGAIALACAALAMLATGTPAQAQAAAAATASAVQLSLPSQPLAHTLGALSRLFATSIGGEGSLLEGKTAPALQGQLTLPQALDRALAGSGLTRVRSGASSFTVVRAAEPHASALPEVRVTASTTRETATGPVHGYTATRSATASKTDSLLVEIPQSISVVTADEIGDRKAESLDEALRYTAGVTPNQRPLGSDDSSMLRGFPIETTGIFLDGLRNSGRTFSALIEPYGLERLEVLRGPSSVLYGQTPPGGLVNAVSKRPTLQPVREIGVEYGSYDRRTFKADFGGPIDDNGAWSYRLTMLGRESGTRLDHDKDNRLYIAPALTWQPSAGTRLTLLARYQKDNQQYAFPNQLKEPGPLGQVSPSLNLSGDDNRFERSNRTVGLDFEHRFNDIWSFRQNLRYSHLRNERTDLFPVALVDGRQIERYFWPVNTDSKGIFSDSQLQARFGTGSLQHKLLLGVDYTRIRNVDSYPYEIGFVEPLDIYNPSYARLPRTPAANPSAERLPSRQLGLYAQDQIKWRQWVLTAGLRHDRVQQSSATTDLNTGITTINSEQSPHANTGRIGAVYLFESGWAPYVSYATSFAPELGSTVSGAPLVPSRGRQTEVGVRYQPAGQRSMYTASVFDIVRKNVTTAVIGNPGKVNQAGEISARGVELEARSALTTRLNLIAQYTYLDTLVKKSNNGDQGLPQQGAPKHSASVWGKYSFPVNASLQAYTAMGVRYLGKMRSNADGSNLNLTNSALTLWDAAIGLEHGPWRVSVNVNNLFNRQALFDCGYLPGVCYRSAERTANLSASYQF